MHSLIHPPIAYCLNVLPLDTPEAMFAQLPLFATELRKALNEPDATLHFGLWFPAVSATQFHRDPARFAQLKSLLAEHRITVPTLNAFPYGKFHGEIVKEKVYLPDWSDVARLNYTLDCASLLSELLPPDTPGAISTLPLGYRTLMDETKIDKAREHLEILAAQLKGTSIRIAVEPEPGCVLETWQDFHEFWQTLSADAQKIIGLCHDTAHAEVMGSPLPNPVPFPVWKIQLSAAFGFTPRNHDFSQIQPFREPVYLHQTRIGDTLYNDIPDNGAFVDGAEAVVHYHLPLFANDFAPGCRTCVDEAKRLLNALPPLTCQECPPVLEIETYTWSVVPAHLSGRPLAEGIADEYRWVHQQLSHP